MLAFSINKDCSNPNRVFMAILHVLHHRDLIVTFLAGHNKNKPSKISKIGGETCPQCNAGSYQDITGQTTCILCPKGKYQSASGMTSCKLCPVGTFQNAEGNLN